MRFPSLSLLATTIAFLSGCDRSASKTPANQLGSTTNVLLITLDTTRADRMGFHGHKAAQTPTLDALAGRAVVFEDAQATIPLTLPAHATILTGRFPREHGLRINGQGRLPDRFPTLATVLEKEGAATAAFVSSFVLDRRYGLDRGFRRYDDEMTEAKVEHGILESERPADVVTKKALDWLEANQANRFFCWVHYYDPHHPYAPPPPYNQRLAEPYDGEIAFVDSQIARIIDWLGSRNLMERTLIVVAGDHGESFGEHGEFGHTTFIYETNLRVPLLFAHPSLAAGSKRVSATVSLVDVFPTMLDLLGLAKPNELLGQSLAPTLNGAETTLRPCYAESEFALRVHNWAQQRAIITPEWKFVSSTKPELFDRTSDRAEQRNLAEVRRDVVQRFHFELQELYDDMIPGAPGKTSLTGDAARRLESLGYVSGGRTTQADELLTPTLADPKDMIDVMMLLKQIRKLVDDNRSKEAVPLLEQAVGRSPESVDILQQLGQAYLKSGRTEEAFTTLKKAMDLEPDSPTALRAMADTLMAAGRRKEAIQHYELALEISGEDPQTLYNLGTALLAEQRLDEAITRLREALKLQPHFGDAMVNLGIALLHKGALEESRKFLMEALETQTRQAEAHHALSQLATRQGRSDVAEVHLKKSIESNPAYQQAIDDLYKILLKNKRTEDAVVVLREAVRRVPQNVDWTLMLAEILATSVNEKVRNGEEAVRLSEPLVNATQGRDLRALTALAAAKAEMGDFESAIQYAEKALVLANATQNPSLVSFVKAQLEAFQSRRPFRNASF